MEDFEEADDKSYDAMARERELRRLHDLHSKSGYIEGVEHGKGKFMQDGFDLGFRCSGADSWRIGVVKGIIDSLLLSRTKFTEADLPSQQELEDLQKQCEKLAESFGPQQLPEQYDASFLTTNAEAGSLWENAARVLNKFGLPSSLLPPLRA